jgi:RNA polymerase sigma factor (sigma-70 family)
MARLLGNRLWSCGHNMSEGDPGSSREEEQSMAVDGLQAESAGPRAMRSVSLAGDLDLVSRVKTGDREAFAALYDRYAGAVYGHCLRLTGSAVSAEDLTAIVFLEAWRRRSDFRAVADSAAPWLHGIAYNTARNFRRSSRRYQSALRRLDATRIMPDPTVDVVDRVAAEETIRRLLPAIRALPRHEREAIELCFASGMTYEEAAGLLNVPLGTLKSRLSRGLSKLRDHLQAKAQEEDTP